MPPGNPLPFHPVPAVFISMDQSARRHVCQQLRRLPLTRRRRLAGTTDVVALRVTDACGRVSPVYAIHQHHLQSLPVSLVSFETKRNRQQVLTSWVTASGGEQRFFTIGARPTVRCSGPESLAGGAPARQFTYQVDRSTAACGGCYYRLRQTDYDGRSGLSLRCGRSDKGRSNRDISIYRISCDRFMLP